MWEKFHLGERAVAPFSSFCQNSMSIGDEIVIEIGAARSTARARRRRFEEKVDRAGTIETEASPCFRPLLL